MYPTRGESLVSLFCCPPTNQALGTNPAAAASSSSLKVPNHPTPTPLPIQRRAPASSLPRTCDLRPGATQPPLTRHQQPQDTPLQPSRLSPLPSARMPKADRAACWCCHFHPESPSFTRRRQTGSAALDPRAWAILSSASDPTCSKKIQGEQTEITATNTASGSQVAETTLSLSCLL